MIRKVLLSFALVLGLVGGFALDFKTVSAEEVFDKTIATEIKEINNENLDNGNCFVIVLTKTDYMTATEWDNTNYKWLNDEFGTENRASIDYEENNVANAFLDQNLTAYNFAEKILIDGTPLSEFGQTHPYTLIANKRTRVDTISIDFGEGVLDAVETVEIQAGCQLPTLSYAYRNLEESSCLEISEGKKYMRSNGVWVDYFGGYAEGTEYKGNESNFRLSLEESFHGHETTPLNGYTDVFMIHDVQGEKLDHKILVSGANTEKGNLMVLNFVHPIDAKEFTQINLRVYINHAVNVSTYNAEDITEADISQPLQTFSVGGGMFSYLPLTSAFYANDEGMVETVVFCFEEDCEIQLGENGEALKDADGGLIRDTFHFVSFNLSNPELITEDSFSVKDCGETYSATFRFNKAGAMIGGQSLDFTKVTLNDYALSEIAKECPEMTAQWESVKGIYQITVTLPKTYEGKGCIKNQQYDFANNHMGVLKGLRFPDGDVLTNNYACHLYTGEKILDTNMVDTFKSTEILYVRYSFDSESNNLRFTLYFDKNVTSSPYYHVCETEHWRSNDLYAHDKTLYDAGTSQVFVDGGYKSSLMNNVLVNGKTIGEWHAHDSTALTNVQVHYGNTALNCVDVIFAAACPNTYDALYALVTSGEGIEIEVKSGLKFMVNTQTESAQTFVLKAGSFVEQLAEEKIAVYYDGRKVENGDVLTSQSAASESNILIEGVSSYDVTSTQEGDTTTYTIHYGQNETFVFSVKEDVAKVNKAGCRSSVAMVGPIAIGCVAAAIISKKRKNKNGGDQHEKVDN